MRVAERTAYHVRIPLVRPIRYASHARTSTDNLVVRCVLDDGTEGFGEGVPRDYVCRRRAYKPDAPAKAAVTPSPARQACVGAVPEIVTALP
jgi:hypothetical protein